jgi:thiamine phosphate synthase YjbQ (UPF0047 family)
MITYEARCDATPLDVSGFVDLTDFVQAEISRSGVSEGRATIASPGEGSRVFVNERETGLLVDIKQTMSRLGMDARIVGSSTLVLPISDGRLHLGTWQRVLMYDPAEEADHSVTIHVVGE